VKRGTNRRPPGRDQPLPPGGVWLVCAETGDWVGDVLEAAPGRSWWGAVGIWRRYHVSLVDIVCKAGHRHVRPPGRKVAGSMGEARRRQTSLPLTVYPAR
jgi:hypothetical protein